MSLRAYYNEFDPGAAAWLRQLIADRLITPGEVDERSIVDVRADDLVGFDRVHFFAGIGGWDHALNLAGWGDRPVWTGSCPCQPFSGAGKRKGTADERHLWPDFFRLIGECGPSVVFGEQVASKDGRGWLAGVRADLEAVGYRVGAADLCAAGVGAPHIRQRLWWVADTNGGLAGHGQLQRGREYGQQQADGELGRRMGDSRRQGLPERIGNGRFQREAVGSLARQTAECGSDARDFWSANDLIPCRDGKARRVEPGTFPLAHGLPARVGRLRGYGNAIVPQVAAEFIQAYREARSLIGADGGTIATEAA